MALKNDFYQVGLSATPGNNFVLQTDAAGGFKLSRGILVGGVPVTTQDVLSIDANGKLTTPLGGEMASTGDFKYVMRATAQPGWLPLNGTIATIGAPTSGATRANNDTFALFSLWWSDYTDAQLPILTITGAASTRGANAGADWDAGKRLTVFDERDVFTRGASATNVNGTLYPATEVVDNGGNSATIVAILTGQAVRNSDGASAAVTTGFNTVGTSTANSSPIGAQKVRPLNRPKLACVKL